MFGVHRNYALLLDCFKMPAPELRDRLDCLGKDAWEQLVATATRHGVRHLLYERLRGAAMNQKISAEVEQHLREGILMNGVKNQLLYANLEQILKVFLESGIQAIVLKGAHLAAVVYENAAVRIVGDIDLLVRKNDLLRAIRELQRIGYSWQGSDLLTWVNDHPNAVHIPPFYKPPPNPRVEVHWRLAPYWWSAEMEKGIWCRAQPVRFGQRNGFVLSPEDLLIHLCWHGCGHHVLDFGVRLLFDVQAVLHSHDINWEKLLSLTKEWHFEKCVYLTMRLAREVLASPVPADVLEALRPSDFDERWVVRAIEKVMHVANASPLELVEIMKPAVLLRSLISPKGLETWKRMLPSHDYMAGYMQRRHKRSLDPGRRYTSYLTRITDWLGDALRSAFYCVLHPRVAFRHIRDERTKAKLQAWLG